MEELVWTPYIAWASLAPNPATVGETVTLRVFVADVLGGQQEEAWFSGTLYSGEV